MVPFVLMVFIIRHIIVVEKAITMDIIVRFV